MSVSREPSLITYLQYLTQRALLPRAAQAGESFAAMAAAGGLGWVIIPNFQRGLVWNPDTFQELLESESKLLGTAIFGRFAAEPNHPDFRDVPGQVTQIEQLIDGLQRFCIGTALLCLLQELVLHENAMYRNHQDHFKALRLITGHYTAVFQHNDVELSKHARKAISGSYKELKDQLSHWIHLQLTTANIPAFAEQIRNLFVARRIAVDAYSGFRDVYEIASTFIGLNTVRIELGIVDWLRSLVVDQGGRCMWTGAQIEEVENRFTEVFCRDEGVPEPDLIPWAAMVKDLLSRPRNDSTHDGKRWGSCIFPNWGTSLTPEEVFLFLNITDSIANCEAHKLLREIRDTGSIPLAGVLAQVWRWQQGGQPLPTFELGGTGEDGVLLMWQRACYRALFDGRIRQSRRFAEAILIGEMSIEAAAEGMSAAFLNKTLGEAVDESWLEDRLRQADTGQARRYFNACLLPERGESSAFEPVLFGNKTNEFQIDHMIPKRSVPLGSPQPRILDQLVNLAPVTKTTNHGAGDRRCSLKVGECGSYGSEVATSSAHPYVVWLWENQRNYASQLDLKENLEPAIAGSIGRERIDWLKQRLLKRL